MTASIGSEVISEDIRPADELEAKLNALRETIETSIARGGNYTAEDVEAIMDAALDKLQLEKA